MAAVIERDVIIVGAGPAGSICASYLARAGFDVLMIDKELFPRDKVCGDIVREGFVKHADALEAVAVLDSMSSCVRKLRLISGDGHEAVVPFECYTIPRYELDRLMADTAVSWGAEFRQGCRFVDVIYDGGMVSGVVVREKGRERIIRSRIVIGADGVSSEVLRSTEAVESAAGGAGGIVSGTRDSSANAVGNGAVNGSVNSVADSGMRGFRSSEKYLRAGGVSSGLSASGVSNISGITGAPGTSGELSSLNISSGYENPDGIWMGLRAYFKGLRLDRALSKEQYEAGGIFAFDNKQGPAYFWIMPVGAEGVKRGICNVGMLARGRDRYKLAELEHRMQSWLYENEKIAPLFTGAERISPWDFGRIADVTQNRKPAGDGYLLIGDAAARVMPIVCDGLSAAADSAKAAAAAVDSAFRNNDFSAAALTEVYEAAMDMQRENEQADRQSGSSFAEKMKLDRLLMESMNDPHVMDKIVARLAKDAGYRKKAGI